MPHRLHVYSVVPSGAGTVHSSGPAPCGRGRLGLEDIGLWCSSHLAYDGAIGPLLEGRALGGGTQLYLSEVFAILRRHWVISVVGVLLTGCAAAVAAHQIAPVQSLRAEVVLLPPRLSSEPGVNPFLSLGGLNATTDILARTLTADEVDKRVEQLGGSTDFLVFRDQTSPGPLILVEARGDDLSRVSKTLAILLKELPENLEKLQSDIDVQPSYRITSTLVRSSDEPDISRKSQIRGIVAILTLGIAGTVFLAATVDSWQRRRCRRIQAMNGFGTGGGAAGDSAGSDEDDLLPASPIGGTP